MSFRPTRYPCKDTAVHPGPHDHTDGPDGYYYTCPGRTVDQYVLRVMRCRPGRWFVNDLAEATGLGVGKLYAVLARLEQGGLVESWWQFAGMENRRRYYQIAQEER